MQKRKSTPVASDPNAIELPDDFPQIDNEEEEDEDEEDEEGDDEEEKE